ncbi:MAG: triose-phosphate isomerase [Candidatus Heimdallarchaeaceae archaeon]
MKQITFPVIILNFKNYSQAIGKKGLELAKIAEKVVDDVGVSIIVCPQTADIRLFAENVSIPIFAQHVDSNDAGSHTGNNLLETLQDAGAKGSLVNHSEKQLKLSDIESIINKAKKHDFYTVVCANNQYTSMAVAALDPPACAMEPPELIGSGISVTTRPELVKETINAINSINPKVVPLVGAGVSTATDVFEALQLGAHGVLLASGFVKAKDPKKVLEEMAKAATKNR